MLISKNCVGKKSLYVVFKVMHKYCKGDRRDTLLTPPIKTTLLFLLFDCLISIFYVLATTLIFVMTN
jgi:hypothetical protein